MQIGVKWCVKCPRYIYVIKGLSRALLGRPAIQALNIISKVNVSTVAETTDAKRAVETTDAKKRKRRTG